jgi:hypothetical protein
MTELCRREWNRRDANHFALGLTMLPTAALVVCSVSVTGLAVTLPEGLESSAVFSACKCKQITLIGHLS